MHDGALHERAAFSHTLYAQPPPDWEPWMTWARASRPTTELDAKARPFVGVLPLFRTRLSGELPNRDTWLHGEALSGRSRQTPHARVRVLTAWEHLAGPGRGAPKSPAGLDPMVWKELQVTEAQRREACARVATELEQALTAEPDALPFDETLPEVWPELPSPPFAPPPPSARGYQVRLSSPATTVMSIEARVAFRVSPSPATLARLRTVLARA